MNKSNGHGRAGHNSGMVWLTRSFNNIERNPEIDKFVTLYRRSHIKEDDLAAIAGLSTSTVKKMIGGDTRDPRSSTFQKLAVSFGCEYGLREVKKVDYDKEIPKAKEQRKLYHAMLARKRERQQRRAAP